MYKLQSVLLILLFQAGFIQSQEVLVPFSKKPFTIGETLEFYSKTLGEERALNIYLPESYGENPSTKYPVIYLLDGSSDEDFIHIAGLVQFASFPWLKIIPPSIVVGITNIDRKRDFTYQTDNKELKKDFPDSGGSAKFIEFLKIEVLPLIEKNYAVSDTSTLIGQSLGGLLATEILLNHPSTFNNYIIVSPSLWWDDESLLDIPHPIFKEKKSIYIAVGKEGATMERLAKALHDKLINENTGSIELFFKHFEELSHGDALHLAVYDAFQKMFRIN